MTNTDLLCELLANPFGNEQTARELLSEIDGRPPSDVELERGLFCFQIALYFLACLTITAHIEDSSRQRKSIDRLNGRVRTFYARKESQVAFSELVVSPAERDQSMTALPQQSEEADASQGDPPAPPTTMLALFDLVAARRLCEYVDAIGQSDHPRNLRLVAERVLFHYGAKEYHPAAIAAIADLLAARYSTASAIVVSGLRAIDAPQSAGVGVFMPMPLMPRIGDITAKRPSKIYSGGTYILRLLENVGAVGGGGAIRYRYVLALCERELGSPICLVTLEDTASISNVLGVFEQNGSHSNYGTLASRDREEFMEQGMNLIRDRFDLDEINEMSQQPRWAFWQNNEAMARPAA